ncbi:beta lactamase domain, putative [Entamoeba dispar SAW760]|uniref:Beta lactamase domain, putative n=1 Tax=Entamoeba dispar (strain ATCC PRA-260 / SAW760) TaxID=370354 RepID=B0ELX7_ENTDS|nr:beta lactamase domain, putative [Entamoeba dispar SAW760]EDR24482.1 beta lactamase domain, putative [Entamoeba dispar SAW760]|eukprot:EDR24482.1 beta lactamase domain, putative [Entamoeba dispar SAW760]
MAKLNSLIYSCLPTGIIQANCCILGNPETGNYIVTDVGGDADRVISRAKSIGLKKCIGVYFTHGHFDHVSGAKKIKELTGAPLCLHEKDIELYNNLPMQCDYFGVPEVSNLPPIDIILKGGDEINLDGHKGVVLHTPGHSPGSCSFYFKDEEIVINGDTLFAGSYGRTDLWGSSFSQLKASIKNVLFSLPMNTIVVTGHGSNTTIREAKKSNMICFA